MHLDSRPSQTSHGLLTSRCTADSCPLKRLRRRSGWASTLEELGQPNVEIAVATALDLGDRRVEIAHLGRGHTDGDLVVVMPDSDVLFTGDLLESAGPPSFGPDSVPDEWPATLDAVIGLMTATTLAIPGHGEPVDRKFVFEQRGWIAAQAAQRGTPPGPNAPAGLTTR